MTPTAGSAVRFVLLNGDVRDATIARVVEEARSVCNLQVRTDGPADAPLLFPSERPLALASDEPIVVHRPKAPYSAEPLPGTWHWPGEAADG